MISSLQSADVLYHTDLWTLKNPCILGEKILQKIIIAKLKLWLLEKRFLVVRVQRSFRSNKETLPRSSLRGSPGFLPPSVNTRLGGVG